MSDELKPCPFCGGNDLDCAFYTIDDSADRRTEIQCRDCGATGPIVRVHDCYMGSEYPTATGDAWNRRTSEPMTSVITWTRYDGTPETLPEESVAANRKTFLVVTHLRETIEAERRGMGWYAPTYNGDIDDLCVYHVGIMPGDLWAYLPRPPEAGS